MSEKSAILCVDDELLILLSLKQELKNHFGTRFVYEIALNAEEAFEVMRELEKEGVSLLLIISDWLMPGIRGDEFLIEACRRFPGVKTVLVTGQADYEAIENARALAGLQACIMKPWNQKELIRVVEKCALSTG